MARILRHCVHQLNHFSTNGHLSFFCVLAIVNTATETITECGYLCEVFISVLLDKYLEMGLLGNKLRPSH